jgi:hypothetical protein
MTRGHKARRVLAHALGVLVALQVVLNVLLDTVKPEWRDPEYGHRLRQLQQARRENPGKKLLIILGSSRMQMGLNPRAMGLPENYEVYNFAQSGCGPAHEYLNFQRLLAEGIRPDFLAVEILPALLAKPDLALPVHKMSHRDFTYLPSEHSNSLAWFHARIAPWYEYRSNLLSHMGLSRFQPWQSRQDYLWKQLQPGGWMPYFFESVSEEKRAAGYAVAEAQYRPSLQNMRIHENSREAYEKLVGHAHLCNIPILFFTMPEGPRFRTWYSGECNVELKRYFQEMAFLTNSPVLDMSTTINQEDMFADGHHLMRHGAEITSRHFGSEVKYLLPR